MFFTPLGSSTLNQSQLLTMSSITKWYFTTSFWLLFFLFRIFPSSSSLPSRPTSTSIFCILPSLVCPPKVPVLHLDSLRAFTTSCLMLYLFMHVSWFSVKNCKPEIGKHVSKFGSMIPIFVCLPLSWYPLRMFELLTLAFTGK